MDTQMTRTEVFDKFVEIFSDVMDIDDVELTDATTADDVAEWDSLSHVRLMVAVERGFALKFTNAEIEGFKCVGDLINAIAAKKA